MSRPLMVNKATKADEAAQSRIVHRRDKTCAFEVLRGTAWVRCDRKGATDCAHIIRRGHLSPRSKFHPDVALLGCRECHSLYDAYEDTVRVPIERARAAWRAAVSLSKVPPPRRYDPDAA